MAQSNRHWPSMFKSKPYTTTTANNHHHNPSNLQHDTNASVIPTCKAPFSTGGGCEERSPEPKPRWNPKPEQIRILESIFNSGMVNPPRDEIRKIRAQLQEYGQVGDANVFYWFQNRKSRSKHKNRQQQNSKNNRNTTGAPSPTSLHHATTAALAARPTSSSSSSEKSYPRDKILKMSSTTDNVNNINVGHHVVGVDHVSNLNSPTGSVNQTYFQPHMINHDYFVQQQAHEPQQQFFFPVQQSGTILPQHHPAYTSQAPLCFNDLSAGGSGGSTSSGSVITGGGGGGVVGNEQQQGGMGSFSSLLLGEMIGGGSSVNNESNSHHVLPPPPAAVGVTRRGEVVDEDKLKFQQQQQQQELCFFVSGNDQLAAAANTNAITTTSAVSVTASISSLSQIQGVGDQSNAVVEPPLKSTVFINDVAFEVPVGPFNVRDAFGYDALLVNAASGLPVLTDDWGITLQSLPHGGSYYLVRTLSGTPAAALLFDKHHDQTDLLAPPEFPFQI